jgi:hypothetical protein
MGHTLVLGKHVTRLEFLAVLLGDEPALEPEFILYHQGRATAVDESDQPAPKLTGVDHIRRLTEPTTKRI